MKKEIVSLVLLIATIHITGCKDLVNIDPPKTEFIPAIVFASDDKAKQAIAGLYAPLLNGYASGDITSITYLAGLSSDELIPGSDGGVDFYNNSLLSNNAAILDLWSNPYKNIYNANALLEGLEKSTAVTVQLKQQLLGEAKFLRAFSYFCLVNLYGDVPLNLTTDYSINAKMPRTQKGLVYDQIVTDLKDAQQLLSEDYSFSENERVRANKWVATALLARVYLYRGLWSDAAAMAGTVINNTALFKLCTLDTVFRVNSKEAIWQLSRKDGNSQDAATFINPANAMLRTSIVNSFENNDQRRYQWITSRTYGGKTVYYPEKYKATGITPVVEYSTILRLAEQYLIRAEARAQSGNIDGAASDLNMIRSRAGLSGTTATTKEEMLLAIEQERLCELFTEWGHRWFDLKRWPGLTTPGNTRADDILKPLKNTGWQSTDVLYPIPREQTKQNPNNIQNPGYQ